MKKKKLILSIVTLCIMLFSTFALCSCGTNYVSPWGKTLSYSSLSDPTKKTYILENEKLTITDVLEKYFNEIDWDTTLSKTKDNVKNPANAMSLINQKATSNFSASKYKNLKFEFSDSKTKQATVDGKKYTANVKPETKPKQYEITIKSSDSTEIITLIPITADCFYYETNIESGTTSALPTCKFDVTIKFKAPIETANGVTTPSIAVTYYALYKVQ